jgi:hypothetical protein
MDISPYMELGRDVQLALVSQYTTAHVPTLHTVLVKVFVGILKAKVKLFLLKCI